MIIRPAARLAGRVELPGDKSISHRAAMLAAIAVGRTRISNFAASADCASTLDCIAGLGVEIERSGTEVMVHGRGKFGLKPPMQPLDCGNSGTTMRLLTGILAGQPFKSVLVGDGSLSRRPMRRIIEPLSAMGSVVEATDGHAPLHIRGRHPLAPIEYRLRVASAQLKSCILLAGLFANGETTVIEAVPTRDHSERMLKAFGADVRVASADDGIRISIDADATLNATDVVVPADVSSAAFFLVAASCLEGSRLELPGVGLNPTRTGVIEVLRRFGANIDVSAATGSRGEPTGILEVRHRTQKAAGDGNRIDGPVTATIIDEIPVLAVFGTQVEGGIEIRDAGELRVKESDRIRAVVENLRRMGAEVEEFDDGLRVGRSNLHGAAVDSFGDHRIAMAFAVAGLMAEGETEIMDPDCIDVSFPGFFDVLESVAVR